ncbi:protein YgfX [Xenorhabdus sp. IM139775]|uniref:protein YgfX n=1 Tax=Xenorhabdus sp. IM139775 TaxID=3025876 RepID=UPI002359416E|nr:protein YgfX [Xenorhabdus sp. IM139775]MDC9593344.1 protein YgfX [Xenorhabdus sp. IM139775]
MVLWSNKLRGSRHTRLFSTGVHGGAAMAALLAPWPINSACLWLPFFWFLLFAIISSSWAWSQKNIRQCQGRLVLFKGNKVHWQNAAWSIAQPPWFHRCGMVVMLHAFSRRDQPPIRLWIASDSMSPTAWRHLNQLMRQYSGNKNNR